MKAQKYGRKHRIQFYLTGPEWEGIKAFSAELGIDPSTLIRASMTAGQQELYLAVGGRAGAGRYPGNRALVTGKAEEPALLASYGEPSET